MANKKKGTLAALLLGLASLSGTAGLQAQPTPGAQLLQKLENTVAEGRFYFGHHDDPVYGHEWCGTEGRSDVKETTGFYPGLMNWDLGLIEWGSDKELDGVDFERIRREIVAQDARGGINSFSWHVRNVLTRGDSWDVKSIRPGLPATRPVSRAIDPSSALNDTLCAWIGRAADFIGSLRRPDGTRIGVVFRPWHEHSGSWFWWGREHCTPAEYKALWRLTRRVFDERGVDNVVWAYSPDVVGSYADYMERYPGDGFVDLLGADVYHRDGAEGTEAYARKVRVTLRAAQLAAQERGKVMALTETGLEGLPMPHWWTQVLLPALEGFPVAYVCVWRNAHDLPTHFYAPFPGQASAPDFREFCKNKRVVMSGER